MHVWNVGDADFLIPDIHPVSKEMHHELYGSLGWPPKGSDWIRLVFVHLFPLNSGAPIASANFIHSSSKTQCSNPKTKVEIYMAILGFHRIPLTGAGSYLLIGI